MDEKKKDSKSDVLLTWEASSRPFKKRDRSFFLTTAVLAFLIIVILFMMREFLIVGTALAVVFVAYALAAVPPPQQKHQITEKGIWVGEVFYRFSELSEYWFETYLENTILILLMPTRTVGRIVVVIPKDKKEEIDTLLRKRLVFREKPLKTFIDTASDWLKRKVPLEED